MKIFDIFAKNETKKTAVSLQENPITSLNEDLIFKKERSKVYGKATSYAMKCLDSKNTSIIDNNTYIKHGSVRQVHLAYAFFDGEGKKNVKFISLMKESWYSTAKFFLHFYSNRVIDVVIVGDTLVVIFGDSGLVINEIIFGFSVHGYPNDLTCIGVSNNTLTIFRGSNNEN